MMGFKVEGLRFIQDLGLKNYYVSITWKRYCNDIK